MIAFLLKLTALLAAGSLTAALVRSQAAAMRHLVWMLTLAASIALAALHPLLPPIAVPVPRLDALTSAATENSSPMAVEPEPAPVTRATIRRDPGVVAAPPPGGDAIQHAATARPDARTLLLAAWLAGVVGVGAWWLLGHAGLARLTARAKSVTSRDWQALLDDLLAAGRVRRDVELRRSPDVGSPVVWGVRRPVILLPERADDWSDERRRAVLAHELGHVERRDGLVNAMACIAAALYWFHPLTWLALHRLRIESERACDDRVLSRGTPGADYAGHLLEIARGARTLRLAGLSAIGMARRTHLEGRLLAVLDEQRARGEPRVHTRVLLLSALVLGVPLLAASRAVPLAPDDTTLRLAAAATKQSKQSDQVIERTLEASAGERLTLDLETGASVTVRGWNEPQARVRVQLAGRNWPETRVDIGRDAGEVRVHTSFERGVDIQSTSHSIEVMVPQRYDVELHSSGGDLTLSNLEGRFEGKTGGGTITLSDLRGEADLGTGGGEIRVTDVHLSGTVRTGGGKVELRNVSGGLRGTSGSGPVISRDADDGRGGSKDGRLHISQAGGEITLDEITDGAVLHTGGGDIRVRRASGDVEASTGGGDIDIGHVSGGVKATTGAGAVDIEVDELASDGRGISVSTGNGTVVIELPADVGATFDLETAYTEKLGHRTRIESDFDLPITETDTWDRRVGSPRKYVRARGQVGGGGPLVEVRAVNGNVRIVRR